MNSFAVKRCRFYYHPLSETLKLESRNGTQGFAKRVANNIKNGRRTIERKVDPQKYLQSDRYVVFTR